MLEYIAIIDTETTGLDVANNAIIEIAVILYHIPTRHIMAETACLLQCDHNEAFEINKISVAALKIVTSDIEGNSLILIEQMLRKADALIAHNAEFDKKWIEQINLLYSLSTTKNWICTKNDVLWNIRKTASRSLSSICIELGVPIITHHRAIGDCHLLLGCIEKNDNISDFLLNSGAGRVDCVAIVSFDQRQLAKDYGFTWDNNRKQWRGKFSLDVIKTFPFEVVFS